MSIRLVLSGRVYDADTNGAIAGIVVKAFLNQSTRAVGTATTDQVGSFTMSIEGREAALWSSSAAIRFGLYQLDSKSAFHRTERMRLRDLTNDLAIAVPDAALSGAFEKPVVHLLADGESSREIDVGQTLSIAANGLRPSAVHDVTARAGGKKIATMNVVSDQFGVIAPTVIAQQLGLSAFDAAEALTLKEATKSLGGSAVTVELRHRKTVVARPRTTINKRSKRPIGFVSDPEGRLRNYVQWDRDPLHVTVANVPVASQMRIYVVPRQANWNPTDPIVPALDRQGARLVTDLEPARGIQTVQLAAAGELLPGAYDLIVRPVRYGFEADEELRLLASDVVIGRHITGLVVREDFWRAKAVLGGCVNVVKMSGALTVGPPYFRYRETFAVGENVWASLDPGIVMPGQIGKKVAHYVIQSKTPAQWAASTALTHVPPGQPIEVVLQNGCINHNEALVWPAAGPAGDYDIVADFGNNSANPATFVKDGSYDTPLDMIDGYFNPGFRIVDDPGTLQNFANVGAFDVDATLLAGLGLSANLTVTDENTAYFTPGGFVPISTTYPRLAIVRFPADAPGATTAAQISAAQPNYPLAMVVHGNGHNYTSYAFLLDHLARNGFIAMSIHLQGGMYALGRANAFFDHLNTINTIFGTKVQNNVGVLGHSRGAEAVFKIARLNVQQAMGVGLNALVSLAPTDQNGDETITGAQAVPLFVLYGAKDGDVSGWPPYSGYNVRQSGFSLYDRFDDQNKSMAFVYEATHNGFVTANEIPVALTVADQQKILLAYSNAFFRMHLKAEPQWEGLFMGEWRPPSVAATPAQIYFQYRDTQRQVLDNFEGAHSASSWQTSTIGDAVTQTGLPSNPVETQLFPQDNQSPHDTGGLRFVWDNLGDKLEVAIPAGSRNVTAFNAISIRVGQVVGSASNPAAAQNFRLTLRDGGGNARAIRVSAFGVAGVGPAIPIPADANVAGNKKSAMATIRIPLSAYTTVCAGAVQVDLTNVTSVALEFNDMNTGEIAADEIEFSR